MLRLYFKLFRPQNVDITIDNPTIDADMYEGVRKLVMVMQRIDNQDNLAQPGKASRVRPTILIFLPGILEIDMMYKKLEEDAVREKYFLMPLHSSITFEEQQRAFRPVAIDMRKIVLTTNIAESSVTIPDVKYGAFCVHNKMTSRFVLKYTKIYTLNFGLILQSSTCA